MILFFSGRLILYTPPYFKSNAFVCFFGMGRGMGGMLPAHALANTEDAH
jgi:hypothetical protein